MKQSVALPQTLWSVGDQETYIEWANTTYWKAIGRPPRAFEHTDGIRGVRRYRPYEEPAEEIRPPVPVETLVQELYTQGRFLGLLRCPFHEFTQAIVEGSGPVIPGAANRRKRENYFVFTERHGVYFREPLRYRHAPHHQPKVIDETTQHILDWRERKGFRRDHARANGYYAAGRKANAKRRGNRNHRRWEKAMIRKGDFEAFFNRDYRDFVDPWDWD